jgi:hypothetical protein
MAEHPNCGRLARTVWPQERQHLPAGTDGERIHSYKVIEFLGQILGLDHANAFTCS